MHRAVSIVLFTSLSGAGYGAMIWLGVLHGFDLLGLEPLLVGVFTIVAMTLVGMGLVSSTFHLHHPERAWRALSQWRSSWLSREGVMALVTFVPALLFAGAMIASNDPDAIVSALGFVAAACSVVTIVCTAMIYRSLWTVPQWHNAWTIPCFLVMGLAGGALIVCAFVAVGTGGNEFAPAAGGVALIGLVLAVLVKLGAWRAATNAAPQSTTATAIGLTGRAKSARLLESPNSSQNYLQKEMAFRIARKHALKLRRIALLLGFVCPALLLITGVLVGTWFGVFLILLAAGSGLAGTLVERWLFFAEATHKVSLYYGTQSV
ncbi:MAG: dimethyl sulfoxide reductase anchor subunit [Rhodospirillaceae bacterium]|nr:dimethyl sulfoxide reductase anchor subunit [Rhodospirillaceae bacterium]